MPDLLTIMLHNGLWLLVPIILWNVALAAKLPPTFSKAVFWSEIPRGITIPESLIRVAVFALPAVTIIEFGPETALGFALFGIGVVLYFASWVALIARPDSRWSRHPVGLLAPAYTPAIWLTGIPLMTRSWLGHEALVRGSLLVLSLAFLGFHLAHTGFVVGREAKRAKL